MKTKIKYGGKVIAFTDSPIINIPCRDLRMCSEISIAFGTLTHGTVECGDTVVPVPVEGAVTIHCFDTRMPADIVIHAGELTAPTITLDGDILTIADVNTTATAFAILSDGVVVATVDKAVK